MGGRQLDICKRRDATVIMLAFKRQEDNWERDSTRLLFCQAAYGDKVKDNDRHIYPEPVVAKSILKESKAF